MKCTMAQQTLNRRYKRVYKVTQAHINIHASLQTHTNTHVYNYLGSSQAIVQEQPFSLFLIPSSSDEKYQQNDAYL